VYFSGHGASVQLEGFVVPEDAAGTCMLSAP
jgi:hypothetical protein